MPLEEKAGRQPKTKDKGCLVNDETLRYPKKEPHRPQQQQQRMHNPNQRTSEGSGFYQTSCRPEHVDSSRAVVHLSISLLVYPGQNHLPSERLVEGRVTYHLLVQWSMDKGRRRREWKCCSMARARYGPVGFAINPSRRTGQGIQPCTDIQWRAVSCFG